MQSGMDESDSTVPTVNLLDLNDHWKEALTAPAGWRPEPFVCGRKRWLQASYYMNILRHRFFLEVVENFYPEGVKLPVTTLPAPTKMTRQWVSSILVSWGYQVYHLKGMQPASEDRLEKLLQDHPDVSGSYDWEGWLKTTNPIMTALYGNMPDPIKRPLDWQCILVESKLSGNPPAPMVESNPASWQLCLETVVKELDKRQPGSSPEVPMQVDPPTVQPSSFKRPLLSPPKKKDVNYPRFHPAVIHLRGRALLSGNVSEPNVPPAPSSNSEGLSCSEYNSWGLWLTPLAAFSESELREPIEEGVEIWETFRKQSYCQQQDQQLLDETATCNIRCKASVDALVEFIVSEDLTCNIFFATNLNVHKIGWVTLDNPSNNDILPCHLEEELLRGGISFDREKRHVLCFPHAVNLACKAVLKAILRPLTLQRKMHMTTDLMLHQHARRSKPIKRDPVREALEKKDLQLLRDVDIRWSSTLLMIEGAITLQKFRELPECNLSDSPLEVLQTILVVPHAFHAFQQRLSAEKTQTLRYAILSFKTKSSAWKKQVEDCPDLVLSLSPVSISSIHIQLVWILFLPMFLLWQSAIKLDCARESAVDEGTFQQRDDVLGFGRLGLQPGTQTLEAEVEAYILDMQVGSNPLTYWQVRVYFTKPILEFDLSSQENQERYPETMSMRRSQISPELMEALQILKFSSRQGSGLNFTAGTSRSAELKVMEALLVEEGRVPEDISTFVTILLH
ncbi:hypothetical protein EV702DRAFT_1049270 [Suillus placidus]|uniref:Uncharacterized protein n=1 Tax=Suillus placidus TaxID=48579 RepID=A0A9P6ZL60_9AGAM|nr:hypothetical protein EV702DRAFT_1049270 [Suillus placidus]